MEKINAKSMFKLDQFYVQVSLELNVIDNSDQIRLTITTIGVITREPSYHAYVWEYPIPR